MEGVNSSRNVYLLIGGCFSSLFAVFQVSAIFWSQELVKFFGGPVAMQSERPLLYACVCVVIGALVTISGLYAFSGAGRFRRLPFARTILIAITAIYLLRGLELIIDLKVIREHPELELTRFAVYSAIALLIGVVHLLGVIRLFRQMRAGSAEEGWPAHRSLK